MSDKEKPKEGGGLGKAAGIVLLVTIVLMVGLLPMFSQQINHFFQVIRQNQGVLIGLVAAYLIFKATRPKKPEAKKEEHKKDEPKKDEPKKDA